MTSVEAPPRISPVGVKLNIQHDGHVMMDNGLVQVTISNPDGIVTCIGYNGINNLLEVHNQEDNRGYWDLVWTDLQGTETTGTYERIRGTSFKVIVDNGDQVEISFIRSWHPSLHGVPLKIDKRFVMLRGSSGFYSYAIYEHLKEWPGFRMPETRIVFKLHKDKFHYMVIADDMQRKMPMPEDRSPGRCEPLAYPEAVLLTNPIDHEFKGEVDDKYQYSSENKDNRVHGWICSDPPTGFWVITPSDEFKTGGPTKQDLTCHVGPIALSMFMSAHYSGDESVMKITNNEPWKKVFGPVFIYLNSVTHDNGSLWKDAKAQMLIEVQSWPYIFPASKDFPSSDERGSVSGRLLLKDRYIQEHSVSANLSYIGLALPGTAGSWQRESKGYQFWTKTDEDGIFSILDVHAGEYNLYAWVPGVIGDYRYHSTISITPGRDIDLGEILYEPPRYGPTLWEIGVPSRSAAGFYVPDTNPKYISKLLAKQPEMRFRQYGLWERYTELYPKNDLIYTVGVSEYHKDWFFAQVTRKKDSTTYLGTTWQIVFKLDMVDKSDSYKLRIALASANVAELQVRINNPRENPPLFTTGLIGTDNSVMRRGIHGLYWLYHVTVPGDKLVLGKNTVFLTQSIATDSWQEIMYDYIRFEGPTGTNPAEIP